MARLDGKVVVITGGASGIGAATAQLFVAEGARVVIGDLQADLGAEVAADLGTSATFRRCDVSREEDVASLVQEAVNRWGRLDCIFNNAGFGGAIGPVSSISEDDFDLSFDVLLTCVFFGMKHAAPVMQAAGSGSIISTASAAGLVSGLFGHLYSVAKGAVIHLTRSVALELAEEGIRVNAIAPGNVATPLSSGSPISVAGRDASETQMQRLREELADAQPIRRVGEPVDVANAALFLCGDESQWLTGQVLAVDGGLTVGRPWRTQPEWARERHAIRIYRPEGR